MTKPIGPKGLILESLHNANSVGYNGSVDIAAGVAGLSGQVGRAMTGELKALAVAFSDRFADGPRRTEMFRQVGAKAQKSVSSSYGALVTRQEGPAGATHYRDPRKGGTRLSGGVMRRALNRGDFFAAAPDGIAFVNVAMLDKYARHWHRLAFGAEGIGEGSNVEYDMTFNGLSVASLGYNEPASPAFRVPPGVWLDPSTRKYQAWGANDRGADMFYPLHGRKSEFRMSRGIEGKPFLEAGLQRIAKELPKAMDGYYKELFKESRAEVGYGQRLNLQVRAAGGRLTTPRAIRGGFTDTFG